MMHNKYQLKNKQSQMTSLQALVTILLAVIILLLSTTALNNNSQQLVSATQDAACRAFLESYDTLAGRAIATQERFSAESSFFGEITKFCRTEQLIFESREEEDVFNRYAQASRRCYERYGSGNLNFLDFTQKSGSYCFVCAEVEFENVEDDQTQTYSYRELGKWMEEEIPQRGNNERENFRDLSNLLYADLLEGADIEYVQDRIENNQNEFTGDSKLAYVSLEAQFQYLKSIYERELSIQEKSYVVYKYESGDYNPLTATQLTSLTSSLLKNSAGNYAKKRLACGAKTLALAGTGIGAIVAPVKAIGCVGGAVIGVAGVVKAGTDQRTLASMATDMTSVFSLPGTKGEISSENEQLLQKFADLAQQENSLSAQDLEDIPKSIIDILSDEEKNTYNSITRGESVSSNKEQELIGRLLIIQSERALADIDSPSWNQYVEILPQGEFYNQCGPVPNQE